MQYMNRPDVYNKLTTKEIQDSRKLFNKERKSCAKNKEYQHRVPNENVPTTSTKQMLEGRKKWTENLLARIQILSERFGKNQELYNETINNTKFNNEVELTK